MEASPQDPALVYMSFPGQASGFYPVSGTSEATPLFAGIVAVADQVAGTSLGFLNPALYTLGGAKSPGLVDVTSGGNSVVFVQNGRRDSVTGWNAKRGYDLASGWGTVDGDKLVTELVALHAKVEKHIHKFSRFDCQAGGSLWSESAPQGSRCGEGLGMTRRLGAAGASDNQGGNAHATQDPEGHRARQQCSSERSRRREWEQQALRRRLGRSRRSGSHPPARSRVSRLLVCPRNITASTRRSRLRSAVTPSRSAQAPTPGR